MSERGVLIVFPDEVLITILSYLDAKSLCNVSLLNSFWKSITDDESFWKLFLYEMHPSLPLFNHYEPMLIDNEQNLLQLLNSKHPKEWFKLITTKEDLVLNPWLSISSTDGGEYSNDYGPSLMLTPRRTYCTKAPAKANVNVIIKSSVPFVLRRAQVKQPGFGFTAPVGRVLIFVTNDLPNLENFETWNDCDQQRYTEWCNTKTGGTLKESDPVAFFHLSATLPILKEKEQALNRPALGSYILVKLIDADDKVYDSNIDVQYTGFTGIFLTEPTVQPHTDSSSSDSDDFEFSFFD